MNEQMFRELEAPYYVAAVQAERSEAREVFERLGAKPNLATLGRERAVA